MKLGSPPPPPSAVRPFCSVPRPDRRCSINVGGGVAVMLRHGERLSCSPQRCFVIYLSSGQTASIQYVAQAAMLNRVGYFRAPAQIGLVFFF